jgi:hypothetical protein
MSSDRYSGAKASRVHPLEFDLALARAILDNLEPFLKSPEPFWPLTGTSPIPGTPFPQLSLGALALTLDELRALEDGADSPDRSAILSAEREFERIQQKWEVALERKALAEGSQRLHIWKAYLEDLSEGRIVTADYAHEVRQRVALGRLMQIARANPDWAEASYIMGVLDVGLEGFFVPGEFIWDDRLQRVYPKLEFWFLYGKVRGH